MIKFEHVRHNRVGHSESGGGDRLSAGLVLLQELGVLGVDLGLGLDGLILRAGQQADLRLKREGLINLARLFRRNPLHLALHPHVPEDRVPREEDADVRVLLQLLVLATVGEREEDQSPFGVADQGDQPAGGAPILRSSGEAHIKWLVQFLALLSLLVPSLELLKRVCGRDRLKVLNLLLRTHGSTLFLTDRTVELDPCAEKNGRRERSRFRSCRIGLQRLRGVPTCHRGCVG